MKPAQLSIQIDNIRAIKNADIKIDGITVIAGENGCGKSTISKLVYYFFKTIINYNFYAEKLLKSDLNNTIQTIESFFKDTQLSEFGIETKISNILSGILENGIETSAELDKYINSYKEELTEKLNNIEGNLEDKNNKINRLKYNLSPVLHEVMNLKSLPDIIIYVISYISQQYQLIANARKNRPASILHSLVNFEFNDYPLPNTYNISEYGVPLIENEKLLHQSSIDNIAYIDTPMALGQDGNSNIPHWEDLKELLKRKPVANNNIKDFFNSEILGGEFKYLYESFGHKQFTYKRSDGFEFDLLESATGLKSFAVLEILFKNGFLNNKTLLLIDEPEAHLHPQWIVEYAKLIVQLNKNLGVKFLIASHNPDMISAIKYISAKEDNTSNLNFYLAVKSDEKFKYNYKDLGIDIEPIFESFNIALDKIEEYGSII